MQRERNNRSDHAPRIRQNVRHGAAPGHAKPPAAPGHDRGTGGGGHAGGSASPGHAGRPASPGHGGSSASGGHGLHASGFTESVADTVVNEPPAATLLVPIEIASIYTVHGQAVDLPERMAWCTPDMYAALIRLDDELHACGGRLVLSDLYRTYDMQLQAHLDWKSGKKSAYSPPPGESMHEAGRALDLDLKEIQLDLGDFWEMAQACGLTPIIAKPNPSASEAWHFDCRGSHERVYRYYQEREGVGVKPYTAMSMSAVLASGGRVDRLAHGMDAAAIQCALIRLGFDPGLVDGAIGPRTRRALSEAGVTWDDPAVMRRELDAWTHAAFPGEYRTAPAGPSFDHVPPAHLVA